MKLEQLYELCGQCAVKVREEYLLEDVVAMGSYIESMWNLGERIKHFEQFYGDNKL